MATTFMAFSIILLGIGHILNGVAIFALLKRIEVLETRADTHADIFTRQLEINKNLMKHCAEIDHKINEKNS